MFIAIQPGSELPVYRQIMRQVVDAIAAGRLAAGDRIPSHRELSEQLVVAPDVRVYVGQETGHDGLGACAVVATRYGAGRGEGIIAIVGPKRIDYRRVLPWVRLLGSRLGQVLDAAG